MMTNMAKKTAKKENKEEIGLPQRLRKLRIQKELSQAELAGIIGIHYNQVSRYERGTSQPTADKINKITEALGVSGDYLLNGEKEDAARGHFEDREFMKMFQEAEKLPEQDKNVIKRLIHALLNQRKIEEMAVK